jgi:hypothetical protein
MTAPAAKQTIGVRRACDREGSEGGAKTMTGDARPRTANLEISLQFWSWGAKADFRARRIFPSPAPTGAHHAAMKWGRGAPVGPRKPTQCLHGDRQAKGPAHEQLQALEYLVAGDCNLNYLRIR